MRVYLAAQVSWAFRTSKIAFMTEIKYVLQVMSESVASALQFIDNDGTEQTRLFIRTIDKFFDCMNVKGPQMAKLKRKANIAPYKSPTDERFKVL